MFGIVEDCKSFGCIYSSPSDINQTIKSVFNVELKLGSGEDFCSYKQYGLTIPMLHMLFGVNLHKFP